MNVSKKALSLVLALALVTSTFMASGAFADTTGSSSGTSTSVSDSSSNLTTAKEALTAALEAATQYTDSTKYTADTWSTFQVALKDANAINENTNATATTINGAAKALNDAITGLNNAVAAKSNLQAEIEKGDSINGIGNSNGTYDAAAWSNFQTALEGAKSAYENTGSTQDQITKALTDLETAIKGLVLTPAGKASTLDALKNLTADPTKVDAATVKDLAEQVEHFSDSDRKNLTTAEIAKLETALETATSTTAPTPSTPDTSAITNPQAQMTQAPTVSGLLLAAGYTGAAPLPTITLVTRQESVSDTANSLAFDVDLTVNGTETHALAVPVTVTIKLPASFVYNSSYNYTVHHIKDASVGGGYEDLPLKIVSTNGAYTGTFTTNSFSDFTVVATAPTPVTPVTPTEPTTPTTPTTPTAPATFVSDTAYNFGVNGSYLFKITSKDGKAPTFAVGTPDVFKAQLVATVGSDYFYKITAVGAPGACAGIYVNGSKLLVATVKSNPSYVKSDTGRPFSVKAGKSYTFKLTANSKPTFVAGTPGVFKVNFVKQIGKDYFFKITAVGKPGNASGFYIINQSRVTVVTIAK